MKGTLKRRQKYLQWICEVDSVGDKREAEKSEGKEPSLDPNGWRGYVYMLIGR